MGFVTVKEVIRRRKRNVSRKPKIATINEWRSQEENELDPEKDTFHMRNRHCWDWWNLEALSDNEDVFEKEEKPKSRSSHRPRFTTKSVEEPNPEIPRMVARRPFVRARSAEPESNLSRKKSKSLPDLGMSNDTAANKYKRLLNFWEQITSKKK